VHLSADADALQYDGDAISQGKD